MNNINLKKILQPGANVVVVGLGSSGISAVRFLLGLGVNVTVSEGGHLENLEGDLVRWLVEKGVHVETGGHTSELFCNADCVLVSPGVPLGIPAIQQAIAGGVPVIGELALAKDFLKTSMVAITGTNGKSTVTTLIGDLLRAAGKEVFVGGNIGVPLTEYLQGPQEADFVVLEVSSFQLDGADNFRPEVAVLLNISPDHLDRYPSYDEYVDSKMSIFKNQGTGDTAIINGNDRVIGASLLRQTGEEGGWPYASSLLTFADQETAGDGIFLDGEKAKVLQVVGAEKVFEEYDLGKGIFSSAPNSYNAMAAILAVRACGSTPEAVERGLSNFTPLKHRLELVAQINGVRYFDDSKATNVGAVLLALEGMAGQVVLIAGGRDKGGSYDLLVDVVREKVRAMVLIGEAKDKMASNFRDVTQVEFAGDMDEAVRIANTLAKTGDAVLLSPACASFDMFRSYGHRGEVFSHAVQQMAKKGVVMTNRGVEVSREASFA
jgi:UDP-N-acetylmuramoylalanine--D-glutamate ligase